MNEFSEKQKQIIQLAIELIAEKSIQGLTIKNLSKKLGVTEGAIYRHFESKLEILSGILTMFQTEAISTLDRACSTEHSAMQKIENIFIHHFTYFTEKPAVTSVIFSESIFQNDSHLSKEVYKLLQMHEKALECIIEEGQKNNELRNGIPINEMVRMIIGSIRYTVTKWRLSHFEFDLLNEGTILLNSIKELIKK